MKEDKIMLFNYAAFLERTLEGLGYDINNNEIMEVIDSSFNATSDYLGRVNESDERNRELILRTVTENVLDRYLGDYMIFPNVNIVYSQMPFKKPDNLIKKMALVPILTPSVAVFGAYGSSKFVYQHKKNSESLNEFVSYLDKYDLDYDHFYDRKNDKYFELIITKKNDRRF
ncbi:MAG: hypothetical protein IKG27_04170 [Bacilli bacterium]|nr:hypothetical protein [Bacilli bacterium]